MFKRIVCFLSAVIVATSSAFAWDAYSFTGVYDVFSTPNLLLSDSSTNTLTGSSFLQSFSPSSSLIYSIVSVYHPEKTIVIPGSDDIVIPEYWEQRPTPADGVSGDFYFADDYSSATFISPYIDFTSNLNDGEFDGVISAGNVIEDHNTHVYSHYLDLDFDISSLPEFYTFSLSGALLVFMDLFPVSEPDNYCTSLSLIVNGSSVVDFYPDSNNRFQFSNFIYSSTTPITSVLFRFTVGTYNYDSSFESAPVRFFIEPFSCEFSVLKDTSVLDGFNDEAQNNINDHESIESQWTGSMSSNFDALDMDSFSFPSGLLSGFSLITGIFQDLWNGMGEYKIVYVFPLFLGIALLLIGRISKFSGGQSSSKTDRGNDDA